MFRGWSISCRSADQQPQKHTTSTVMDEFTGSTPRETLERVAASLGCSPTSAQVASYLDQHDKLLHLREKFLVPKIADLPTCESVSEGSR